MSLTDAVNIALRQNANILKANHDLEAAHGVVIQTRAIAIPRLVGSAGYTHDEAVEVPSFPGSSSGSSNISEAFPPIKDKWTGNIRLVQSIFEGGRIWSSLRAARLTREQAVYQYQTVVADTLLQVRTNYYSVLLAEQEIAVQVASVELLKKELQDTTRRFDAGTVPRFNVLRAEVEVANAQPRLIRAKNAYRIAKSTLVNVLGYNLPSNIWEDIPLHLSDRLAETPYTIELPAAIAQGLRDRPELKVAGKGSLLQKENVTMAKGGYWPSVQVYGGYGARNSSFRRDFYEDVAGLNAGVEFNWNIFDGTLTRGKVAQAKALYEKSQVEVQDLSRRIELEIRTAYSQFIEAKEVLESQKKVLEQADEALRLAKARYDAGTGTQLDVLNAQTSLTEARTTNVQALNGYVVALAQLQRAVGSDLPQTEATPEPAAESK